MIFPSGRAVAALLAVWALAAGCTTAPPPPRTLQLSQVAFAALPSWKDASLDAALASFRRGCAVLVAKPAAERMSGAGYAGTVGDWLPACKAQDDDPRHFFEGQFTAYAVGGEGLFTGYYDPQIDASRTRQGGYQTPVYGLPPDLVRVDLGDFSPAFKSQHIAGMVQGRRLVPYPDRAAIDRQGIAAPVILYTDDPVALFFLQIQGSGRARLPDGTVVRLSYAGDNGQPYTAIGRVLIEQGALSREDVSLQTIRAWLRAHPERAQTVMETDKSYVFLREAVLGDPALGSPGTMGVNLTPEASLAVDARLHALGAPFYVVAQGGPPGLMIAQDTGGAIRGAVRGDIFFGSGPQAETRAGNLKADGTMFVLLPNALAAKIGGAWTAP